MTPPVAPGQRVSVWGLQDRKDYPGRRWAVRWKVGTSIRTRSFKSKLAATKFRSRLESAADDGLPFDVSTGLPVSWAGSNESVAVWAKQWFDRQSPTWAPRSRRNASDTLTRALCELVADRASSATGANLRDLRSEIRAWLAGKSDVPPPLWLRRWSLPLNQVTPAVAEAAAQRMRFALNGRPVAPSSQQRIRATMRAMFGAAVAAGRLVEQPWPAALRARKVDRVDTGIDVRRLPNPEQAREVIEGLRSSHPASANFVVLSWMVYLGGLRPSEALALQASDCTLPAHGWGEVLVKRAVQDAGRQWTEEGEKVGPPKVRRRRVPIPPSLVKILREHLGDRQTGYVAQTRNESWVSPTNWSRAWRRTRGRTGHAWQIYDLRHACATLWLGAGVPVGQAARRLGHSPETLLRDYAGVLVGEDERANRLIESVLPELG